MAVALINYHKLTGLKLNVVLNLSGFEDETQKEKLQEYTTQVLASIKTLYPEHSADISMEMREEEFIMYGMKNVFQFLEVHQ